MQPLPQSIQKVVSKLALARPRQIILFGSRARGSHRSNSDFDFCIVGRQCPELEWSRLTSEIEDEPYTLFPLDIVEFEKLSPAFQEAIRNEGHVVYEER